MPVPWNAVACSTPGHGPAPCTLNRRTWAVLILVFLLLGSIPPAAAETGTFTLTGHVWRGYGAERSDPLPGVQILVWATADPEKYVPYSATLITSGTTDAYGAFSVPVPYDPAAEFGPAYWYLVMVTPSGYSVQQIIPVNGNLLADQSIRFSLPVSSAAGADFWVRSPYAPTADFTLSDSSGPAPLDVTITDTSTGSPTSWSWTFAGPIGAQAEPVSGRYLPVYTLTTPGNVTVTLTVSNAYGSDTLTKTITVYGSAPVASFTFSPSAPSPAPATVSFTDTSSNNPTGWSWNFGDGATSPLRNPAHTYTSAGTYTVRLTAYNQYGSGSATHDITTGGSAPRADFSLSPSTATVPLYVSIADTSTGSPTSWSWTFTVPGRGTTSYRGQYPPSLYVDAAGTTTVTLQVGNAYGSDSAMRTFAGYPKQTFDPVPIILIIIIIGAAVTVYEIVKHRSPDIPPRPPDPDATTPPTEPECAKIPPPEWDVEGGIDAPGRERPSISIGWDVEGGIDGERKQ